MIPFMNDTQSVEGQPRFDVLDVFRVRRDESGQAPGRDGGRFAELFEDAFDHPVDLGGKPVEDTGLDRFDHRATDDRAGPNQFDRAQRRGVRVQRVE